MVVESLISVVAVVGLVVEVVGLFVRVSLGEIVEVIGSGDRVIVVGLLVLKKRSRA